jgi:hypothetical protein
MTKIDSFLCFLGLSSFFLNRLHIPKGPTMATVAAIGSGISVYLVQPETTVTQVVTVLAGGAAGCLITEGTYRAVNKTTEKLRTYAVGKIIGSLNEDIKRLNGK